MGRKQGDGKNFFQWQGNVGKTLRETKTLGKCQKKRWENIEEH
jgi:hypothetical protein